MSTLTLILALSIVAVTILIALALGLTATYTELKRYARCLKGFPVNVTCPVTGQVTRVRIGTVGNDPHLKILSCERFDVEDVHCGAPCFPELTVADREEAGAR